jgi:hypothetical protein
VNSLNCIKNGAATTPTRLSPWVVEISSLSTVKGCCHDMCNDSGRYNDLCDWAYFNLLCHGDCGMLDVHVLLRDVANDQKVVERITVLATRYEHARFLCPIHIDKCHV